jgi:hypothetical protein
VGSTTEKLGSVTYGLGAVRSNFGVLVDVMLKAGSLIMTLPKDIKHEVLPSFLKAKQSLMKKWKKAKERNRCPTTLIGAAQVDDVIDRISDALWKWLSDKGV